MAKILFACYHSLEYGTVEPVSRQLKDWGHQTAFLTLWEDDTGFPSDDGITFRGCHRTPVEQPMSASEELICEMLPPPLASPRARRLAQVIRKLHPILDRAFPLQIEKWVPVWRRYVDETIAYWRPDVVVLSLGELETPIVRQACADAKVPCLYLITPFYEFKSLERIPLPRDIPTGDLFCVADSIGKLKLLGAGVPESHIAVTGAPLFDALKKLWEGRQHSTDQTILYADQGLSDNHRLGEFLLQYVTDRPGVRLVIRLHPTATKSERSGWQEQLNCQRLRCFGRLSPVNCPLVDDLSRASVVVSLSSIVVYEAALVGIPSICWHPGVLPSPLCFTDDMPIEQTKTFQQLTAALDRLRSTTPSSGNSAVKDWDAIEEHLGSATNRVCHHILVQSRPFSCRASPA